MLLHRTQVLLERWQHERLKRRARKEGISMSEMLRRIVTAHLEEEGAPSRPHLLGAAGMFEDEEDAASDHDAYLYGWSTRRR